MLLTRFNLRSWSDWRVLLIYVVLPMVSTFIVSKGVIDTAKVSAVVALVGYLLTFTVAIFKSDSQFRRFIYGALGLVATILVVFNVVDQATIDSYLPYVLLVIGGAGGGLAAANTNTTPAHEIA